MIEPWIGGESCSCGKTTHLNGMVNMKSGEMLTQIACDCGRETGFHVLRSHALEEWRSIQRRGGND